MLSPAPVTLLSRSAFVLICSLLVWPPLLRGSVHAWHQGLIQIVTLLAALALMIERYLFSQHRRIQWVQTPWNQPIIAILGLMIISTITSRHTGLAMEGLLMGITYIAIHYLARQTIRTRHEKRILIYVMGSAALLFALIGILKNNDATPFSWWVYPGLPSAARIAGPYGNPNHLAGFIEMALPMLLILFLFRKRRWEAALVLTLAVVFLLSVQGMTLSRGGWSATTISLLTLLIALLFQTKLGNRRILWGITIAVTVVLLILLANNNVVQRIIKTSDSGVNESLAGRQLCWEGTWNLIKDHPWLGTGPGTYGEAYTQYQPPGRSVRYYHAHNDYLEFVAEVGVLAIPIMIWLLFLFFKTGFSRMRSPSRQTRSVALGCMIAVVAILIHSYSDFNFQIPANAVLFAILTALI